MKWLKCLTAFMKNCEYENFFDELKQIDGGK